MKTMNIGRLDSSIKVMLTYSLLYLFAMLTSRQSDAILLDLIDSAASIAEYDPNYCNDSMAAFDAALTRTSIGQFLGYACSSDFFHCRSQSDGPKTYRKKCMSGLVFDTVGTQNCNYDYNVRGCGLSTAEGDSECTTNQFICPLSETCVDIGQRCDGIIDCMLEEDEQNCPLCDTLQFPCVISEQCISITKRCNGITDCIDETDERNCTECPAGGYYCLKSNECISASGRCDGETHCAFGEDENMCRLHQIEKTYLCADRESRIGMSRVCDGVEQCPDGSDERYCTKPKQQQSEYQSSESEKEQEDTDTRIDSTDESIDTGLHTFEIVRPPLMTIRPSLMTTTRWFLPTTTTTTPAPLKKTTRPPMLSRVVGDRSTSHEIPPGAVVFEVTSIPTIATLSKQQEFSTTMSTTTTTSAARFTNYHNRAPSTTTTTTTTIAPELENIVPFPNPAYIDIDQQLFIPPSSSPGAPSIGLFSSAPVVSNRRITITTTSPVTNPSTSLSETRAYRIRTSTIESDEKEEEDGTPSSTITTAIPIIYHPLASGGYHRRGPFHRYYINQQENRQELQRQYEREQQEQMRIHQEEDQRTQPQLPIQEQHHRFDQQNELYRFYQRQQHRLQQQIDQHHRLQQQIEQQQLPPVITERPALTIEPVQYLQESRQRQPSLSDRGRQADSAVEEYNNEDDAGQQPFDDHDAGEALDDGTETSRDDEPYITY